MKVSDKYLLDLLRQVVSLRAGGCCEYFGCPNIDCDPHHVYSRENKSIRYDPDSCLYLCVHHHTGGQFSAHHKPEAFRIMIISTGVRTVEWWEVVWVRSLEIVRFNDAFRQEWKERLQEELRRLEA